MKSLPWFRFYTEAADDPKVQSLSDRGFKAWVNLLCAARKCDGRIKKSEIAFRLRLSLCDVPAVMAELKELFDDVSETEMEPHNWFHRQFHETPGASTERVRKFRKRQKEKGDNQPNMKRSMKRSETVSEQSRADTDTERSLRSLYMPSARAEKMQGTEAIISRMAAGGKL